MKTTNYRLLLALAGGLCASVSASFGQDLGTNLVNYWDFQTNYQDKATAIFGSGSFATDTGTPGVGTSLQTSALLGGPTNYIHCNNGSQPSYITVPASTDIYMAGKSFSISVWIRVTNFTKNWECVLSQGDSTGNYRLARQGSDYPGAGIMNWNCNGEARNSAYPVEDGKWHHIVAINKQGVGLELWQDGVLIGTAAQNGAQNNTSKPLMIGENPGATGRQWGGDIADLAMWTRVLSPTEIGNIYTKGLAGKNLATVVAETPAQDTDGDGLPDWWENLYALNPNDSTGDNGAAGDPDGDLRTNLQEYQNQNGQRATNPNLADTDGDGATDGEELTAGTNPLVADTDGDGLADGGEINTYLTNPLLRDTDGDGSTDYSEVIITLTNPLVANTEFVLGMLMYVPFETNYQSALNVVNPNGPTCTPVGQVTLTSAGKFGNAVQLPDAGGYLRVNGDEEIFDLVRLGATTIPPGKQNLSVSMWFTVDRWANNSMTLICKGEKFDSWRLFRQGGADELTGCLAGGSDLPRNNYSLATNGGLTSWHHVVAVAKAGDIAEIWIDGVLRASGTVPAIATQNNGNVAGRTQLLIGEHTGNGSNGPQGRQWRGKIDDLAVWSRALSATEIANIWNNGDGTSIASILNAGDTDADGIPNWWTQQNFGHPTGQPDDLSRAGDDRDGDGLTNLQEYQNNTNPTLADMDGDGLNDGQEIARGTLPYVADTDGDGLTDGQEINTYGTNPNLKDSDGDGINDGVEIALGTNPAVANPELAFGLVLNMPMDNDFNSGSNQAFNTGTPPVRANTVTASPVGTVTRTAGKFGNAATLTGAGYLSVNGIENVFDFQGGAQSMTVSLWCKASALDTSNQCLIAKGDYADTWRITRNGSNNYFQANGGNNDLPVVGGGAGYPAINTNVWHHVVLVSKYLNTAELWVDGVLQQSGTVPNLRNSDKRLFIGENSGATNRRWKGQIDDLAIWRRALSPTEIASIYNSGTGVPIDTLLGADTDGDGMPDWWEKQFGFDPNTNDAAGDADGDGLINLQENQAHAPDPTVADTDGDGLDDGREFTAGSNPLLADTDGDGLTDSEEANTYLTNPALADSDGDGMPDNVELAFGYPPLVANLGFGFGMLAYFPMDADFNAVNSGVNGFTTTVQGSGVVSAPGKFGNSARLNGSGHLLVNGDENAFDFLPVYNGPWSSTVSMWFTQDTTPAGGNWDWKTLIAKGDGNTWRIAHAGGNPWLWYNVGNGLNVDMPAVVPATNPAVWHHIALIADNNHTECWYDGAKVMTGYAPKLENVATPLLIGNNPGNSNPYNNAPMARQWPGKIDDVAIWGRALSAAEIGQLWNGGTGRAVISPYDDWAYSKGLTGGPGSPTDPAKTADPDGDGVANVLEFFLDGNPLAGDVPHMQPSVVGGNFVLTYLRRDDAEFLNIVPQSSTDVTNWATLVDGVNGVVVSVDERGPAPDLVTIRIPMGSESRIFGRLKYNP